MAVALICLAGLLLCLAIHERRAIRRCWRALTDDRTEQQKMLDWCLKAELPSTCSVVGHDLDEDGTCRWCADTVAMRAFRRPYGSTITIGSEHREEFVERTGRQYVVAEDAEWATFVPYTVRPERSNGLEYGTLLVDWNKRKA